MKHYDSLQWFLYKEQALPKEKCDEMEEHLYNCDECMNIFLSLVTKEEIRKSQKMISTNFTNCVMNNINKQNKYHKKHMVNKNKTSFKNMFICYTAAAAVTIILTFGGFYKGLVDMLPQVTKTVVQSQNYNKTNIVFDLSEKIVNKTSNFINKVEAYDNKEGLK